MNTSNNTVIRYRQTAGTAEWLVIFLHGVGSNAHDIIPLAEQLSKRFPAVAFCAPDGFFPSDTNPKARQWFSVVGVTEENREERLTPALPMLNELIDREAAAVGLERARVILFGFSQGMIMALHLAATGADVAGVIGLSGRLAGAVPWRQLWPSITLIHGTEDPVMPINVAKSTLEWLDLAGCEASLKEVEGLAHQIDEQALEIAANTLGDIVEKLPNLHGTVSGSDTKSPVENLMPTPGQILGPYYPPTPDPHADNDLTRWPDADETANGVTMRIEGHVLNHLGQPVKGALIETWQCDVNGRYRHPEAPETSLVDPNFEGYGRFVSTQDGHYWFRALKPVSYPGRAPHLHFKISAPGHPSLITQMYIEGEAENDTDFAIWRAGDADRRAQLIVTLQRNVDADEGFCGTFNIILPDRAEQP